MKAYMCLRKITGRLKINSIQGSIEVQDSPRLSALNEVRILVVGEQ